MSSRDTRPTTSMSWAPAYYPSMNPSYVAPCPLSYSYAPTQPMPTGPYQHYPQTANDSMTSTNSKPELGHYDGPGEDAAAMMDAFATHNFMRYGPVNGTNGRFAAHGGDAHGVPCSVPCHSASSIPSTPMASPSSETASMHRDAAARVSRVSHVAGGSSSTSQSNNSARLPRNSPQSSNAQSPIIKPRSNRGAPQIAATRNQRPGFTHNPYGASSECNSSRASSPTARSETSTGESAPSGAAVGCRSQAHSKRNINGDTSIQGPQLSNSEIIAPENSSSASSTAYRDPQTVMSSGTLHEAMDGTSMLPEPNPNEPERMPINYSTERFVPGMHPAPPHGMYPQSMFINPQAMMPHHYYPVDALPYGVVPQHGLPVPNSTPGPVPFLPSGMPPSSMYNTPNLYRMMAMRAPTGTPVSHSTRDVLDDDSTSTASPCAALPRENICHTACTPNGRLQLANILRSRDAEQNRVIFEEIMQQFQMVALDLNGSFVVRALLDVADEAQLGTVITQLEDSRFLFSLACSSPHSRRILQSLFERHGSAPLGGVVEALTHCVRAASFSQQGCIAVMRVIEYANDAYVLSLLNVLIPHFVPLTFDAYGNYVVQSIVQKYTRDVTMAQILQQSFDGHWMAMSCNKFASNVMEKILVGVHLSTRKSVVQELCFIPHNLRTLMHDSYGNFVLQTIIDTCHSGFEYRRLAERIRPHLAASPYGHRIESRLRSKRLMANGTAAMNS